MKPNTKGLTRVIYATCYSWKGIKAAWKYEAAFRQEIILMITLSFLAYILPVTALERVVMIFSLALVVVVELINSSIEAAVDRIGDEWHELSGRAKDIGSAAVFVSLILAIFYCTACVLQRHSQFLVQSIVPILTLPAVLVTIVIFFQSLS